MNESEEGQINESDQQDMPKQIGTKTNKKNPKIRKFPKQQKQKTVFTTANYRREKCDYFNKGHCAKGDDCTYRHDFIPDTARKICKFFLSGACSKQTCVYSHNTHIYPCRFFHIENSCQLGNTCRFSHDAIPAGFIGEYMKDNKDHILKLYRQNKLPNLELIEYIKEDLPKKELELLPISQSDNSLKPVLIKKDPRQRFIKPQIISPTKPSQIEPSIVKIPKDPRLKREQKQEGNKVEQQNKQFYKFIKTFFLSYY